MSLCHLASSLAVCFSIISCSISHFLHKNIYSLLMPLLAVSAIFFKCRWKCLWLACLFFFDYFFISSSLHSNLRCDFSLSSCPSVALHHTVVLRVKKLKQFFSSPDLTTSCWRWTAVTEFLVSFSCEMSCSLKPCSCRPLVWAGVNLGEKGKMKTVILAS